MVLVLLTVVVPYAARWTVNDLAVPASPAVQEMGEEVNVAPAPTRVTVPVDGAVPLSVAVPLVGMPLVPALLDRAIVTLVATAGGGAAATVTLRLLLKALFASLTRITLVPAAAHARLIALLRSPVSQALLPPVGAGPLAASVTKLSGKPVGLVT